jgi:hypothetical protein
MLRKTDRLNAKCTISLFQQNILTLLGVNNKGNWIVALQ